MAERRNAQRGLVDGLTADLGGPRTTALLDKLDAAIPWKRLVRPIAALPEYKPKAPGEDRGRRRNELDFALTLVAYNWELVAAGGRGGAVTASLRPPNEGHGATSTRPNPGPTRPPREHRTCWR